MSPLYSKLRSHLPHPDTPVYRFLQGLPEKVTMDDPALTVMTDLKRVKVVTMNPDQLIDEALQKMIHAEVRLLIVTTPQDTLLGLITARDIMGEQPVSYSSRERVPREAIQVSHIMTPRDEIDALNLEDVLGAKVGDIVVTLREAGRQHALVLEKDKETNTDILRGIFSITQIGRQLGVQIEATGKVQSFAELGRLLNAP